MCKRITKFLSFVFAVIFCFLNVNLALAISSEVGGEKVDLGNIHYILRSGDPVDKFDILFVPRDMSNLVGLEGIVKDQILGLNNTTGNYLFNIEPFKKNKSKFNIAYIDKNLDNNFYTQDNRVLEEVYFFTVNKLFKPDLIIWISNNFKSGGNAGAFSITLRVDSRANEVLVHELGHTVGLLLDEYSTNDICQTSEDDTCFKRETDNLKWSPNTDVLGCPKWCQSFDLTKDPLLMEDLQTCGAINNKDECRNKTVPEIPELISFGFTSRYPCSWFQTKHPFFNKNCVPADTIRYGNIGINCAVGEGCFYGANTGFLAFRSSKVSIMLQNSFYPYFYFNKVSQNSLNKFFDCCYPRQESAECKAWRKSMDDQNKITWNRDSFSQFLYCGQDLDSFCQDTDGGINYGQRGTVKTSVAPGGILSVQDSCDSDKKTLYENFCVYGRLAFKAKLCQFGCKDGVCVLGLEQNVGEISIKLYPGDNLISSPTIDPLTFEEVKKFCQTAVGDRFLVYYGVKQKWYALKQISSRQAGYVTVNEECVVKKHGEQASRVVPLYKGYNFFSVAKAQSLQNMKGTCSTIDGNTSIQFFNNQTKKWEAFSFGQPLDPSLGYTVKMEKFCFLTDVAN